MRLKLTIAYDGRPFVGWQSQPGGQTVQDHLEGAIQAIGGAQIRVHGSGRTDTGVHALGQVAHFDPPDGNRMAPDEWQRALNSKLPNTIRVLDSTSVKDDFHARFDAESKTYRYRICLAQVLPPLEHGLAWHLPYSIDREILHECAALLTGEHDFASFAANRGDGSDGQNTTRTIHGIGTEEESDLLELTFRGSGFLYKMVRLLTGSLVRCAQEQETVAWLAGLLENPGNPKSTFCAPADGLSLTQVRYPEPDHV